MTLQIKYVTYIMATEGRGGGGGRGWGLGGGLNYLVS